MNSNNQEKLERANLYENEKEWLKAAKLYEELIEEDNSIELIEKTGWCYSRAADYNKAIYHFNNLAQKQPSSAKWFYMLGFQYYQQQKWDKAIEYFEQALKIYPKYFIVKYRLGYAYIKNVGYFQQLKSPYLWKALRQFDDCHDIWQSYSPAEQEKAQSTYSDILFQHGKALLLIEDKRQEAIVYFSKSLQIKENADCRYNLAKAYYLQKDYNLAKKNLFSSKKYYEKELSCKIEFALGNYEKAINILNFLLSFRKKYYLYNLKAEILFAQKKYNEALNNIYESLKLNKNNHKTYFMMAKILLEMDKLEEAKQNLLKAKQLKKKHYEAEDDNIIKLEEFINENLKKIKTATNKIS
ncbi:MAG TPA: tetratricopeptide repeat protein [Clostridiales bacterium]|nr:tetratricopeptide repeat protein [Clostridiales bacterium]